MHGRELLGPYSVPYSVLIQDVCALQLTTASKSMMSGTLEQALTAENSKWEQVGAGHMKRDHRQSQGT